MSTNLNPKTNLIVQPYSPDGEAAEDPVQLEAYLRLQLQEVQRTLDELIEAAHGATDTPPEVPRRGMVRYARAPWKPLGGFEPNGLHVYWDGNKWLPLGGGFPCFSAWLSTTINTVTGTGNIYRPVVFDQVDYQLGASGAGYDNTTGLFVAPYPGIYHLVTTLTLANFDGGAFAECLAQVEMASWTTGGTQKARYLERDRVTVVNPDALRVNVTLAKDFRLDEGEYVDVGAMAFGNSANITDIIGVNRTWTNFQGHYVCPVPSET